MIWFGWRQFRGAAITGSVVLVIAAAAMVIVGLRLRGAGDPAGYQSLIYALDALIVVAPAVLGLFWGAPLVAKELETGTAALVWSQSVTRRKWLAVKLAVVGAAGLITGSAMSLLLGWAAAPLDRVDQQRFTTVFFGTRGLVPAAYAIFAVLLGVTLGPLVRRTVPAMALTAVAFVVVQVLMPNVVRPHLLPPRTTAVPVTAAVVRGLTRLGREPTIGGLKIPGAWVISNSDLRTANDQRVAQEKYAECVNGPFDGIPECLGRLNLHVDIAYQPAGRYWAFQWLETAAYLVLAALLALIAGFRVTRVTG
ncbi:transmembrane transport protein [Actinoplanes sp. NPDC051411]|uniref:transmembrane transport protein n=1 Tax=Actinoplanes sp. NPDC051411 TaxID=3155522 RepID=UPI00341784D1